MLTSLSPAYFGAVPAKAKGRLRRRNASALSGLIESEWPERALFPEDAGIDGNWQAASTRSRKRERHTSIQDASRKALKRMRTPRNLSAIVRYRYKTFTEELSNFATRKGIKNLSNLDVPLLREWQSELQMQPSTARKRIERMEPLLRFAMENGWIDKNPAVHLKDSKSEAEPDLALHG